MYAYDDGLEPGYVLFDICTSACVFSVFPYYIIIITVMQGYNFGAMTNHRLQDIIRLKVSEHDMKHKHVRELYLVAVVCV